MPRSRRRPGTKKGKTQWQMRQHQASETRKASIAKGIERARRERERASADSKLDDKYANYPGNR